MTRLAYLGFYDQDKDGGDTLSHGMFRQRVDLQTPTMGFTVVLAGADSWSNIGVVAEFGPTVIDEYKP
jgi:hypothetical protein